MLGKDRLEFKLLKTKRIERFMLLRAISEIRIIPDIFCPPDLSLIYFGSGRCSATIFQASGEIRI